MSCYVLTWLRLHVDFIQHEAIAVWLNLNLAQREDCRSICNLTSKPRCEETLALSLMALLIQSYTSLLSTSSYASSNIFTLLQLTQIRARRKSCDWSFLAHTMSTEPETMLLEPDDQARIDKLKNEAKENGDTSRFVRNPSESQKLGPLTVICMILNRTIGEEMRRERMVW